jgi:hypothetical protein
MSGAWVVAEPLDTKQRAFVDKFILARSQRPPVDLKRLYKAEKAKLGPLLKAADGFIAAEEKERAQQAKNGSGNQAKNAKEILEIDEVKGYLEAKAGFQSGSFGSRDELLVRSGALRTAAQVLLVATVTDKNVIAAVTEGNGGEGSSDGNKKPLPKIFFGDDDKNDFKHRVEVGEYKAMLDGLQKESIPLRIWAENVVPETVAQKTLKEEFTTLDKKDKTIQETLASISAANALMAEVRSGPPPKKGEAAYLKLLDQCEPLFKKVGSLERPLDLSVIEGRDYDQIFSTFAESKSKHPSLEQIRTDRVPNSFVRATDSMRRTEDLAKGVLSFRARRAQNEIDGLSARPPNQQSQDAINFATTCDELVLVAISPKHQADLLKAMRSDEGVIRANSVGYTVAKGKVFKATKLDEKFLEAEKAKQVEVMNELMATSRAELLKARDEWPIMTDQERIKIIDKVVSVHCEKMGFKKPKKMMFQESESAYTSKGKGKGKESEEKAAIDSTNGGFDPKTGNILLYKKGSKTGDLESILNLIFHENSHNWQVQLATQFRENKIAKNDPLYTQAMLFNENEYGYTSDQSNGYREQPEEAHAFLAGPTMARLLMRRLCG